MSNRVVCSVESTNSQEACNEGRYLCWKKCLYWKRTVCAVGYWSSETSAHRQTESGQEVHTRDLDLIVPAKLYVGRDGTVHRYVT